jgi:hypothetical protein
LLCFIHIFILSSVVIFLIIFFHGKLILFTQARFFNTTECLAFYPLLLKS